MAAAAVVACARVFGAGDARAEAPTRAGPQLLEPVAPPPGVVLPKLVFGPGPAYPADGEGDAVVVVELVVRADGTVSEARVVEGEEPFAEAARQAASQYRFVPATRDGERVPARIRIALTFRRSVEPPRPPPTPAPAASAPSADSGARADAASSPAGTDVAPTVEEVLVRGTTNAAAASPSATRVGTAEVRQLPGAFGDAFRAIEALPGVTPIVSGLPYFFVRGAPPGNTGYFIDGIRVPSLYHLGVGPSVLHPGLLDHVDFYQGGYPARYGRFTGGILAGALREPRPDGVHGEANVRVFDAGALLEAPFAEGRGNLLVAGRYSYTAAILSLVSPDTSLDYWDYQARVTYALSPRDRVGVFAFGSFDSVGARDAFEGRTKELLGIQFHRIDLRYDRTLDRGGRLRIAATTGADRTGTETFSSRAAVFALRSEAEAPLGRRATARAGADVWFDRFTFEDAAERPPIREPFPGRDADEREAPSARATLYPSRTDVTFGTFAEARTRPSARVEITAGARVDVFTQRRREQPPLLPRELYALPDLPEALRPSRATAQIGVDPRLAVRVRATQAVSWLASFGIAHQPPSLIIPVPGLQLGRLQRGLQTSLQLSQGAEVRLPAGFSFTGTAFVHQYLGLSDLTATCSAGNRGLDEGDSCVGRTVRGRAVGGELLLRRKLAERVTGWVAYTLSRSTRASNRVPEGEIVSEFDRTHVLNVVLSADLGKGYRLGGRYFTYTGLPYSPRVQGEPVQPINGLRLPAFHRIDFRFEKSFRFLRDGRIAFVAEVLNATFNKEATEAVCVAYPPESERSGFDRCEPRYIGPIGIPSLGVEAFF